MPVVKLGTKTPGSVVKLNESNVAAEFVVAHQGSPSSAYSGFDGGTVLIRKGAHSSRVFGTGYGHDSGVYNYGNSDINEWLNNDYLDMLDSDIKANVKQVKIPYVADVNIGMVSDTQVNSGANGLSCYAFLPSINEVGLQYNYSGFPAEGSVFSWFASAGDDARDLNGNEWYTRTMVPNSGEHEALCIVEPAFSWAAKYDLVAVSESKYIRPTIVLNAELFVDDDGFVVTNQPPTAPGSISVSGVVASGTATITLTAATDPDGTIASYRYERSVDSGSWTQFADVNSLTQTDAVSSEWGTVAYRACAVDDAGEAGPYATSETETVNSGWVTIGGPNSALGQRLKPFTLTAEVGVSGQTGVANITVTGRLDGKQVLSTTVTQGQSATIFVDTRVLATGQHTIQMTAEASDYLPANKAWQFLVPVDELPEGGQADQLRDENQNPIFPRTTSQQVIGKNGLSVQNELDNMEKRFRGLTGHLEPVDAVFLGTAGAQIELPRENGVHYCFGVYSSERAYFTMVLVPAGNNTAKQLNNDVTVTPSADKFTIMLSSSYLAIVQAFKFVVDAEAQITTNPVALFTALDQPHVLSASGGTTTTVDDQTDALQTILDENPNANYYILEDTDGNKYYVAATSIIQPSTTSFTGPCYQDDQATTLYDGRTLNLADTSNVPALFTELSNTVYSITTQGTSVSSGSTLNDTLLAMIEAQPTWNRYKLTGSDSTVYYVLSNTSISSDATNAANVYYCTSAGTYYTGGTLSFNIPIDSLAVGATIHIKENGTYQDFRIIHKGSPSDAYQGFDNGVVVLRTDIHSEGVYDSSYNDYANSDLHAWGNGTYLNSIEEDVRNQIMQVKIPYRAGTSGSGVSSGANGLSCKVFFLSTKEVDSTESYSPNEGAVFSYFSGGGNSKRIARYNGQPDDWWLRSPWIGVDYDACCVYSNGYVNNGGGVDYSYGRRPAFVLPNTISLDNDNNVIG